MRCGCRTGTTCVAVEPSSAAVPDCWKARSTSSSVSPGGKKRSQVRGAALILAHAARPSTPWPKSGGAERGASPGSCLPEFRILRNLSRLQFNLKRQNISLNTASKCGSFNFLNLSLSLWLLLKSLRTAILHSSPRKQIPSTANVAHFNL